MKDWRKIDPKTGMFVEDVILDAPPVREDGTPDPAYIAEPVPPGLYWPRWDGSAWVEGRTSEEIATIKASIPSAMPTPEERMDQIEAALIELAGIIAGGE